MMAWTPSQQLLAALRLVNRAHSRTCRTARIAHTPCLHTRTLQTESTTQNEPPIPLRKQLKDEAKARKLAGQSKQSPKKGKSDPRLDKWELTVGIEIHAELNTTRKLFSPAQTSLSDTPNAHVALFDAALPGAQPQFQKETLLPAVRAALALGCEVQRTSSWDRKHYFWWDQPNGYQITQYYHPFALNGHLTLNTNDDIDPIDEPEITIGIKQVQMEQDTAKTVLQPPDTHLLDFNRVSHPLIEIISLPHIHSPKTAAAYVRKVQSILKAIGANTTGMEMGGLRADVNVSVRRRDAEDDGAGLEYGGVRGLGQRTEIKNLSSFKAVEDAIVAERDRQIGVLEAGGVIAGETRGWTLGSNETRRLRGKEGEVDYRYMPDPDLGAVVIGEDLLKHLKSTMPALPDETLDFLTQPSPYGLTKKDARTLQLLDDGERLEYYFDVVNHMQASLKEDQVASAKVGKMAANWILHELGALISSSDTSFLQLNTHPTAPALAEILLYLQRLEITLPTAKTLFTRLFTAPSSLLNQDDISTTNNSTEISAQHIRSVIEREGLLLLPLSDEEYVDLAQQAVAANEKMAEQVKKEEAKMKEKEDNGRQKKSGKMMWFVGWMVRQGEEGRVQPERAEKAVRVALGVE